MTLLHQAAQKAVEPEDLHRRFADVPIVSLESYLRAMADNYKTGHQWDCLDEGVCRNAADEIRALRAAIGSLESALQQQPDPVAVRDSVEHYGLIDERSPQGQAKLAALQHQEVPREPVAEVRSAMVLGQNTTMLCKLPAGYNLPAGTLLYASPSTTRQQEVGSEALDARRYRWLRRADIDMSGLFTLSDDEATFKTGAPLDRAIDAAMLAAAPSTPEKAGGVPVASTYLHASRVDALIAVMEGECDGLAVTRETAEAILHYLDGNAPPVGVDASGEGRQ